MTTAPRCEPPPITCEIARVIAAANRLAERMGYTLVRDPEKAGRFLCEPDQANGD